MNTTHRLQHRVIGMDGSVRVITADPTDTNPYRNVIGGRFTETRPLGEGYGWMLGRGTLPDAYAVGCDTNDAAENLARLMGMDPTTTGPLFFTGPVVVVGEAGPRFHQDITHAALALLDAYRLGQRVHSRYPLDSAFTE